MNKWKEDMIRAKTISTKKKFINFLIFLIVWVVVYYLIKFNFGIIAFILSFMIIYFRTDKQLLEGIVFLASEFDRHHDHLAKELSEVRESHDFLLEEYKKVRDRLDDLESNKAP